MLFPTFLTDANKTAASLWEAGLENIQNAQQTMVRQREIASRMEAPWQVKWSKGPGAMSMPTLTYKASSADATREAFHLMADSNMKAWEQIAKSWAAMPSWVKVSYSAPGEFWSKWFDQWQDGKFTPSASMSVEKVLDTMTDAVKKSAKKVEEQSELVFENVEQALDDMPALYTKAPENIDDLTQIKGIGAKLQTVLNELGVYNFDQMASWTPENIAWLDDRLTFKGRIYREAWVEQAQNILKKAA